jgi:hypothetical protein
MARAAAILELSSGRSSVFPRPPTDPNRGRRSGSEPTPTKFVYLLHRRLDQLALLRFRSALVGR